MSEFNARSDWLCPHLEQFSFVVKMILDSYFIHCRSRKVSVFYNKLGHVEEEDNTNIHDNPVTHDEEDKDYSDLPVEEEVNDEDEDYAFPLDAIKEESDNSIYENPHTVNNDRITDDHVSEAGDNSEHHDLFSDSFIQSPNNNHHADKRKLSLGVIFRKLSSGSMPIKERKASLQERRLSTALTKLITLPIFERRSVAGESYQVNSLSWEFLNKDEEDDQSDGVSDKKCQQQLSNVEHKIVEKHPSTDSLYESEFDSSSTMESTASSTSRLQQQQSVH